jgi:hypothetical protein
MSPTSLLSASLLLAAAASPSATRHYSSPRGFSFDYPEPWVVAAQETQQAILDHYKPVLEKMGKVDFNRMAVLVFDPCDDGFVENLNVVVSRGRMPVNEESCRKLAQALAGQMQSGGLNPTNVRTQILVFGRRKVLSTHWTLAGLAPGVTLRQWQIAVPGANQTYIVTASATTATFPRYEARFRDIFASFQPDGGVLGLWYRIPRIVQYAIIGGIAGGIVGALRCLFKRKVPDAGANTTGDDGTP